MTGQDAINIVGAVLGMKAVTVDTVPSRTQILSILNIAAQEVAFEFGHMMPNLWKTSTSAQTDVCKILGVVVTAAVPAGLGGTLLSLEEFYTRVSDTGENDKPGWVPCQFLTNPNMSVGVTTVPGGAYSMTYVKQPDAYTDAAVSPACGIPPAWDGEVIRVASEMCLVGENDFNEAHVSLQARALRRGNGDR